jgi:hypothetical protein
MPDQGHAAVVEVALVVHPADASQLTLCLPLTEHFADRGHVDAPPGLAVAVFEADNGVRDLVYEGEVGTGDVAADEDAPAVGPARDELARLDAVHELDLELGRDDGHPVLACDVHDEGGLLTDLRRHVAGQHGQVFVGCEQLT